MPYAVDHISGFVPEPSEVVTPAPSDIQNLIVYLIKPSRYDDDGYVVRHWKGVLPSNTLACLNGLTKDVETRRVLGDHLTITTCICDETVQHVPIRKIAKLSRRKNTRLVACMVGVQTNQFSRASDLAKDLNDRGVKVMIGGFHVGGMMSMFPEGSDDLRELTDLGITVVGGEVETRWADLLSDVVNDDVKPSYNFLGNPPPLDGQPLPFAERSYLKKFALPNMGCLDTSRGCPFDCSFCTIINVQGRKMRCRTAAPLKEVLQHNERQGIDAYFFTDDNFSRNRYWKDILKLLIDMNTSGHDVTFMMQVDVKAYRIPGFVETAARAGCTQVFVGMESINPENLVAAGKSQNDTSDYANMVDTWHRHGIAVHVGYIIGFPFDTVESVKADVETLADDVKVDQASFFILTPLPGSRDHKELVEQNIPMDDDFNRFDSFRPVTDHPRMSREEWTNSYNNAWSRFYSLDNMKAILRRARPTNYWNVFRNFMWYKNSISVEGGHPMVTGFFRQKKRRERRPGMTVEGRWSHLVHRVGEVWQEAKARVVLMMELQELWLQTRKRTEAEQRAADIIHELACTGQRAQLRLADWQEAFREAQARVPSRFRLWLARWNLLSLKWTYTREDLNTYWVGTRDKLSRHAYLSINWLRVSWRFLREMSITARFALSMMRKST